MEMKTDHCLMPGYPEKPGLELPDDTRLKKLQREDPRLKQIINRLLKPEDEAAKEKLRISEHEFDKYILDAEGLLLRESGYSKLHKKNRHANHEMGTDGLQVLQDQPTMIEKIKASPSYVKVIPAVGQVQAVLMAYFHGSRAHGHLGYKRTLDIMQRVVYWDGMAGEVRRFVKACWCMKDGKYNLRTLKAPPAHIATAVTRPGQVLAIDHFTLPGDGEGKRKILVMRDAFSRLISLKAVKQENAVETAKAIWKGWIQHYGIPEQLHSDGAKVLVNEVISELCKQFEIARSRITPGNARGNCLAEDAVKRTRMLLKNLTHQFPRKWKQFLPLATYILNNTVSDETGLPPYTVHSGKLPKPLSQMEVELTGYEEDVEARTELSLASEMMDVLMKLSTQISTMRNERYREMDEHREVVQDDELRVGEVVWLLDHNIKSRKADEKKMLNPRTGPFMVKQVSHDKQNAVIQLGDTQTKRVNVRLLQRYVLPNMGIYPTVGHGYANGVPVQVLAHRRETGHEYLTKYLTPKGEAQEWTTWEILPPCMIRDYLHKLRHNPHLIHYHVGLKIPVWWPEVKRAKKGVITSMSGNLARVTYEDGNVGEAMVMTDGRFVEAAAFDDREELMDGLDVPNDHPRPVNPRRRRPPRTEDSVPNQPRETRPKGYAVIPK